MARLHRMPDDDKPPADPREQAVRDRAPMTRDGATLFSFGTALARRDVTHAVAVQRIAEEDGRLTLNLIVEEHGIETVYRWLETIAAGHGITLPILRPTGEGR